MSLYKIEKGIPVPGPRGSYPLGQMEVGDSFFVPLADGDKAKRAGIRSGMYVAAKRLGCRFTVRAVDGGLRVWRVE